MKPDLSVIIPLRNRLGGKTRLAERFTPLQRETLVRHMAETVLDAVIQSKVASQIILVTRDPVFAQEVIGERTGVRIVHQTSRFPGLIGALDHGREAATSTSTLVLFADLPLIRADDVGEIAASPGRVVVVPDRHLEGTNGVLVREDPDAEFRYQFGEESYRKHLAEAGRLWWRRTDVVQPGTATDLDTMNDWLELPERLRDELIESGKTDSVNPRHVAVTTCE
jgi:2-phospho-L-lactate guanylyltransferase